MPDATTSAPAKVQKQAKSAKGGLRIGLIPGEGCKESGYVFEPKTVRGRIMPGVDLHDRDRLFDLMNRR